MGTSEFRDLKPIFKLDHVLSFKAHKRSQIANFRFEVTFRCKDRAADDSAMKIVEQGYTGFDCKEKNDHFHDVKDTFFDDPFFKDWWNDFDAPMKDKTLQRQISGNKMWNILSFSNV